VSYYRERYGHCVLIGKRVQGWIGGKPCWQRRTKKPNHKITDQSQSKEARP
jgi:hypothetical protein